MKKLFLYISVLFSIFFCSCTKNILSENVLIIDGGYSYRFSDKNYIFLDDENFDIRFEGLKRSQNIYLFAYYNDSFINKFDLPVKADKTDIFNQGMAIAEKSLDKEELIKEIEKSYISFMKFSDEEKTLLNSKFKMARAPFIYYRRFK